MKIQQHSEKGNSWVVRRTIGISEGFVLVCPHQRQGGPAGVSRIILDTRIASPRGKNNRTWSKDKIVQSWRLGSWELVNNRFCHYVTDWLPFPPNKLSWKVFNNNQSKKIQLLICHCHVMVRVEDLLPGFPASLNVFWLNFNFQTYKPKYSKMFRIWLSYFIYSCYNMSVSVKKTSKKQTLYVSNLRSSNNPA